MPREDFFGMLRLGQGGADILSLVEVVQGMLDEDAIARGEPVSEPPDWVFGGKRRRQIILLQKKAEAQNLQALEPCFGDCAQAGFELSDEVKLSFKKRLDSDPLEPVVSIIEAIAAHCRFLHLRRGGTAPTASRSTQQEEEQELTPGSRIRPTRAPPPPLRPENPQS